MTAVLDPADGSTRWQGAAHSLLVVVSGSSRDDVDPAFVEGHLDAVLQWARWFRLPLAVMHGAADGVDSIADRWAQRNGVEVQPFPADWQRDRTSAGAIRNRRMIGAALVALRHGWAVRVEAFPGPRSRGTWDLVKVAREHSLSVEIRTADRAPAR